MITAEEINAMPIKSKMRLMAHIGDVSSQLRLCEYCNGSARLNTDCPKCGAPDRMLVNRMIHVTTEGQRAHY